MKKKKPLIIAIVGESGTGKSRAVRYINKVYGINLIQSYTERAKRPSEIAIEEAGGKADHKFLTKEQFDEIKTEDMIAYTQFGDYRYCCLKKDVADKNLYIIDEDGLEMLKSKFSDVYDIQSVRFYCDDDIRAERCEDFERFSRDVGRFILPNYEFDYLIDASMTPYECEESVDATMAFILIEHEFQLSKNMINY